MGQAVPVSAPAALAVVDRTYWTRLLSGDRLEAISHLALPDLQELSPIEWKLVWIRAAVHVFVGH
jgi:hypothetical protein